MGHQIKAWARTGIAAALVGAAGVAAVAQAQVAAGPNKVAFPAD